jgi:hypothetical protein
MLSLDELTLEKRSLARNEALQGDIVLDKPSLQERLSGNR